MASKGGDGNEKSWTQALFFIVIVALLVGVGYGPINSWLNRARKHSLKAGIANLRDAYTAYYAQKSAFPGPDLKELNVANGGTLQEFPVEPNSGSPSVVTTLDGEGGWYHDQQKHEIKVNLLGEDYFGQPYTQY